MDTNRFVGIVMSDQVESIYAELNRLGGIYAEAKAKRVYLTEFRKSKKAILMKQVMVEDPSISAAKAEVEAYAHRDYVSLLEGLQAAVEFEEASKHKVDVIRMQFESWRSKRSTERAEMGLR